MKKNLLLLGLLGLMVIGCAKEESKEEEQEIIEEEPQLASCVDYTDVDDQDLMTYWNLFVADVKCSRGGPDYGASHTAVSIRFVVQTPQQQASGVTPDHAGFSTYNGYCFSDIVDIGVIKDYWEDYTPVQQLWLMYHEFGHDVYKYEHSSNPSDIMWPSITRSDTKINDFIRAKERFLRRSFDGITYIQCPD
ncbi:MAG: hypothetical protein O3A16_06565 [Bacteroidetes bacterium]|nr:hypothetical protein [Bacteroidota bacterium]MDA1345457.1 hypothetical protein [Bacteroidota bacterium]